jgi:hypothetical protein
MFAGKLVVNAFSYGNILCVINDPRSGSMENKEHANVNLTPVQINGFPFLMMYVTKPIEAGKAHENCGIVPQV